MSLLKSPLTDDQQQRAISILKFMAQCETCSFYQSRRWERKCGEETGRGFDCFYCQAEYLLKELGIEIRR